MTVTTTTYVARGAAVAAAVAAGPADTIKSDDALTAAEHLPGVASDASHDAVARQLDEIDGVERESLLEVHDDGAAVGRQQSRVAILQVPGRWGDAEARRVQTCLWVQAAVQKIAEHLDVACAGMER